MQEVYYLHFDSIPSTNDWAKENLINLDPSVFYVITAHEQTAGRGQFSRNWISPKRSGLYVTFCFFHEPAPFLQHIGQILSITCAECLKHCGYKAYLKWPNDILINGKKIAGILVEITTINNLSAVIAGLGLNIHLEKDLFNQISNTASSLHLEQGKNLEYSDWLNFLTKQFINNLQLLEKNGFEFFYETYEKLLEPSE